MREAARQDLAGPAAIIKRTRALVPTGLVVPDECASSSAKAIQSGFGFGSRSNARDEPRTPIDATLAPTYARLRNRREVLPETILVTGLTALLDHDKREQNRSPGWKHKNS